MLSESKNFFALGAAYPEAYYEAIGYDLDYYKDVIPYDQIKVPVHMIHGDLDGDIPFTQAEQAHAGI